MLFNSITFILIFLPTVAIGYYVLRHFSLIHFSLGWLSIASLFFYAWWNPKYLVLLISSIVFNFLIGRSIEVSKYRKFLLTIGISGNLLAIAIYKYLGFFIATISHLAGSEISAPDLLLPLAISFFTFQQIAYLVDTYRSRQAEKNFGRYLLFVSFFPQLIAGPIVHHREVAQQFALLPSRSIRFEQINSGIFLFTIGLAKKVIIADQLAPYATAVFQAADGGAEPTFLEAWGGLLAYSFQLYFDFSGYADMAVGLAKIFGVNLPINFNSPYKSKNIIEFWRRWHITLSNFLRDYLYIPLGGSRKGSRSFNLMATMLLGGLWHGAGWNFIIWGGLHGLYLVANHRWLHLKSLILENLRASYSGVSSAGDVLKMDTVEPTRASMTTPEDPHRLATKSFRPKILGNTSGIIATFLSVSIAWAFFRAETPSGAISILEGTFGFNGLAIPELVFNLAPEIFTKFSQASQGTAIGSFPHLKGFVLIFSASLIAFFAPNSHQILHWINRHPVNPGSSGLRSALSTLYLAFLGFLFCISLKIIAFAPDSEFLYFNF